MMHITIQSEIEVNDFVFGEYVVILLKMLINTKNSVTSRAILPGFSCGITKLN